MFIESPDNPKVHTWSKLKQKKYRHAQGKFLVEGYRLTEELLRSGLVVDCLLWDVGTDELPESLTTVASLRGVPVIELSPKAFASVSDTVTPQGVIAVASMEQAAQDEPLGSHALLLDSLQDPGNVGTLIRSADAFSVQEVVCGTGTVDAFAPKVVRASMGGLFRMRVRHLDSLVYIQMWKNAFPDGRVVVSAANSETACYEVDMSRPTLLVVGSEAHGVSDAVSALASETVQIPMSGMAESLNAGVAGSILLYEMFRQRS